MIKKKYFILWLGKCKLSLINIQVGELNEVETQNISKLSIEDNYEHQIYNQSYLSFDWSSSTIDIIWFTNWILKSVNDTHAFYYKFQFEKKNYWK